MVAEKPLMTQNSNKFGVVLGGGDVLEVRNILRKGDVLGGGIILGGKTF